MEDRRAVEVGIPGAGLRDGLAMMYTLGYLAMMAALMFFTVPEANEKLLYTLAGIMSGAQLAIIKFYFDGSKGSETATTANIARAARTDGALQEIAKTVPAAAALAAAGATTAPAVDPSTDPLKKEP